MLSLRQSRQVLQVRRGIRSLHLRARRTECDPGGGKVWNCNGGKHDVYDHASVLRVRERDAAGAGAQRVLPARVESQRQGRRSKNGGADSRIREVDDTVSRRRTPARGARPGRELGGFQKDTCQHQPGPARHGRYLTSGARMRRIRLGDGLAVCVLVGGSLVGSARAQTINLWPGAAPGSESWKQKEIVTTNTPVGTIINNVVTPTVTVFLPEKSKATGTGIVVAPGGACVALAIDLEANQVARWLQERGIAAFVLKYRLQEKKGEGIPPDLNMDEACKYGIADGIQAMKVVRQHAAEWGVSPDRIGFMGFSAGAMVTSGVLLQADAAARPAFAAPIYGGPFGLMPAIPANLPPIFMTWAQDDELAQQAVVKFYEALRAAGNKPEIHIYSAGGHGFGMRKQGTTSDHWIEEFYWWLEARGFTKNRR